MGPIEVAVIETATNLHKSMRDAWGDQIPGLLHYLVAPQVYVPAAQVAGALFDGKVPPFGIAIHDSGSKIHLGLCYIGTGHRILRIAGATKNPPTYLNFQREICPLIQFGDATLPHELGLDGKTPRTVNSIAIDRATTRQRDSRTRTGPTA